MQQISRILIDQNEYIFDYKDFKFLNDKNRKKTKMYVW